MKPPTRSDAPRVVEDPKAHQSAERLAGFSHSQSTTAPTPGNPSTSARVACPACGRTAPRRDASAAGSRYGDALRRCGGCGRSSERRDWRPS